LGTGWKDKLTRQVCENDGQIERQACEQDGRTYLERGLGKGWKGKPRDRLLKRIEDKRRDRLMNRYGGHRLAKRMERRIIFAYFSFIFASDLCCFTSMRNKRKYTFFASKQNNLFASISDSKVESGRAASWCMTGSLLVHDGQPAGA
jgi:hypothetical protein